MKESKSYTLSLFLYVIPIFMLFIIFQLYFSILGSFLMIILTIYAVYITKNFIELCLVKVCLRIKINYFVLYPFTYDSSLFFNPISLLYNFDGFQDNMYLNIPFDLTKDKCNKLYRNILILSKISLFVASILIGIIFQSITSYMIVIILFMSSCLWSFASFTRYNEFSYGADYIVRKYDIKLFLLQSNGYKYYDKSFFLEHLSFNTSHIEECILLKIIENYVYLMIQNKSVLSREDISLILTLMKKLETHFYQRAFAPQFHTRFLNIIKIIILIFANRIDQKSLSQFQKFLKTYRNFLTEQNEYGFLRNPIDALDNYLLDYGSIDKYKYIHDIIFGLRIIFSYQRRIEDSIKKFVSKK